MRRIIPIYYEIAGVYETTSWAEAVTVAHSLGETTIVAVGDDEVQPVDLLGEPTGKPAPRSFAEDGDDAWFAGHPDLDA